MKNNDPNAASGPIKIDLQQVLKAKMGKKARWVPGWLVRRLERTIHQQELNDLLTHNYPRRGAEFCRGVLSDLDVKVDVIDMENLPDPSNRRVLIVSNHALGGLDGMALIDVFQRRYGGQVYFLVNDMLMAIEPLTDVFVPVNTVGAQSRQALMRVDQVMAGDDPVLIFPAGLVSRLGSHGVIQDLEWKKMFVNKAVKYHRDIIPVFFDGENSRFFYKFARFRRRSGIKFNIEMIYLPGEVFGSRGKTFSIRCGHTIPWQTLKDGAKAAATAADIKNIVYQLKQ